MKPLRNVIFCGLILLVCISGGVEAKRLSLRPLSTRELRAALRESGIGADSPAGKSVSSAFAGLSGFALGITKGIGGSLLFDVITSNVTIDYLTSLLNSTASSTTNSTGTAQEICFNSRSADGDINYGRSNDDIYEDADPSGDGRQSATTTSGSSPTGTTTSSSGVTCIVLGSKVSRHRRQLVIRPSTRSSNTPRRRRNRRLSLRKFRRHRR